MKFIVLFLLFFGSLSPLLSTDYISAFGFRLGFNRGLSFKQFIDDDIGVEGVLTSIDNGFKLIGLYQKSNNFIDESRFHWYFGCGAHFSIWDDKSSYWDEVEHCWVDDSKHHLGIGVDGIVGVEYNFESTPINISFDWKSAIKLKGYSGYEDGAALTIRFYLEDGLF